MNEKHYCPSCGENVDTTVIDRGRRKDLCCVFCGFPIDVAHPQQFSAQRGIFIVDDSKLLVQMINDYFIKNELSKKIILAYDGGSFITQYVQQLRAGEQIDLVILDIVMPVLSGINAAIAMRAIETAFSKERSPILFFSSKRADDQLLAAMKFCAPAHYICKGEPENTDDLCERMYKVANNLLVESQSIKEETPSEETDNRDNSRL
ncbi:MAG: hypothetical protein A2Y62_07230 [Candidatus Fischerbacteria bacterium RBG_13_37_8]|uniref:Response regulatory domain-containing protein n=1 Tax=Candidatus Fischerbacteria bacterium RBG_13_37_8 TaxID=1817863 RepID=A0A1F5VJ25_9BACT|nr:MAG: hypothetical protein A2Y62_07230 [Candidatus Fischerbacteria bacterium RBG_13_37_8]